MGNGLSGEVAILAEIELLGELVEGRTCASKSRPLSRSIVHELSPAEVAELLGFSGDMVLGAMSGQEEVAFRLQSQNKGVLPRNLGIFGTVGSGKSNTAQVVIEEAAANGWAVIVLDVESEYIEMDKPSAETPLLKHLSRFGKSPAGLRDFHVSYPASCGSERAGSEPFTLAWPTSRAASSRRSCRRRSPERNALLDCIEHLESKARSRVATREGENLGALLDPSPQAQVSVHASFPQGSGRRAVVAQQRILRLHRPVRQAAVADAVGRLRSAQDACLSTRVGCCSRAGQRHRRQRRQRRGQEPGDGRPAAQGVRVQGRHAPTRRRRCW